MNDNWSIKTDKKKTQIISKWQEEFKFKKSNEIVTRWLVETFLSRFPRQNGSFWNLNLNDALDLTFLRKTRFLRTQKRCFKSSLFLFWETQKRIFWKITKLLGWCCNQLKLASSFDIKIPLCANTHLYLLACIKHYHFSRTVVLPYQVAITVVGEEFHKLLFIIILLFVRLPWVANTL